jgi:hypothetical protein
MDPVSLALLTALGAGATSGLTDVTKQTIVAGYTKLKERLLARFGQSYPDLEHALTTVEAKPTSQARQDVLVEELTAARVVDDPELVTLAHTLLQQLQHTQHGSQVIVLNALGKTADAAVIEGKQPKPAKTESKHITPVER